MFVFVFLYIIRIFFYIVFQIIEIYILTVNYQSLLMDFVSTITFEHGVAVCPVRDTE